MQEVVIISGKGGTGKTSIAAAFAQLGDKNVVIADCDVDAANMYVLIEKEPIYKKDFYSGFFASINLDKCIRCSKCREVCHFQAITEDYHINEIACEGCGYCSRICPVDAITMKDSFTGKVLVSATRFNNSLVHAQLEIAGENSGKLVTEVKKNAREMGDTNNCDLMLIDGSPGIGCPVIASLTQASLVLIITEPSKSGFHDMMRLFELVSKFHVPQTMIINKSDLNESYRDALVSFSNDKGIPILGEIPYDITFSKALAQRKTILEFNRNGISDVLIRSWDKLKEMVS